MSRIQQVLNKKLEGKMAYIRKASVDLKKLRKMIESGELDEAIGEELDREVGLTPEDIALFETHKRDNTDRKKAHTRQAKPVKRH